MVTRTVGVFRLSEGPVSRGVRHREVLLRYHNNVCNNVKAYYHINLSCVLTAQMNSIFKYMSRPHAVHCTGRARPARTWVQAEFGRVSHARLTDWPDRRRRRPRNWVSSPRIPLRLAYSDNGRRARARSRRWRRRRGGRRRRLRRRQSRRRRGKRRRRRRRLRPTWRAW